MVNPNLDLPSQKSPDSNTEKPNLAFSKSVQNLRQGYVRRVDQNLETTRKILSVIDARQNTYAAQSRLNAQFHQSRTASQQLTIDKDLKRLEADQTWLEQEHVLQMRQQSAQINAKYRLLDAAEYHYIQNQAEYWQLAYKEATSAGKVIILITDSENQNA